MDIAIEKSLNDFIGCRGDFRHERLRPAATWQSRGYMP